MNSREGGEGRYYYGIGGAQRGTPYAAKVDFFMAVPPVPCLNPPWGEIAVVDLTSQQIVWRRPLGTGNIGFPGAPGSFITAGGFFSMRVLWMATYGLSIFLMVPKFGLKV